MSESSGRTLAYEGEVIDAGRGVAGQSRKYLGARVWVGRALLLIGLLAAWELLSGRAIDEFFVSRPSKILTELWQLASDARAGQPFWTSTLFFHLWITIQEALYGFLFGSAAAIVVGLALAQLETTARIVNPFIVAIYSLPKIALAPLFILWFGIGLPSKIIFAAVVVFFMVFWSTYVGAREVDRELLDVVRVMGAGKRAVLTKIVLPSALVWIFTGLKTAAPYAVVGAVVAELIASNRGIGYLLVRYSSQFDTAGVFAVLFVLMILATAISQLLEMIEGRLLRWKAVER